MTSNPKNLKQLKSISSQYSRPDLAMNGHKIEVRLSYYYFAFLGYLTVLSISKITKHKVLRWMMGEELERISNTQDTG